MSVISWKDVYASRRSRHTVGESRYWRAFNVVTSLENELEQTIKQYAKCPRPGGGYNDGRQADMKARCVSIDPRQTSATSWRVDAEWSTQSKEWPPIRDLPPQGRPAVVTWSEARYQISPPHDFASTHAGGTHDKPFINPAGDKFHPVPPMEEVNQVLRIAKNVAEYDQDEALKYANKVNSIPWFGYPHWKVKSDMPSAASKYENGQEYWEVVYHFEIKGRGQWLPLLILNAGSRYIDADGNLQHFDDIKGNISTEPGLLSMEGGKIERDANGRYTPGVETYTEFMPFEEIDLNGLGLP